ncbi:MAG: hypothetical protein PF489_01890 [Salinivirgaceae bacterium]|jgi:hypothetical protein|nr:hypothetical protein [Salinivirgaceae bacterium]
MGDTQTIHKLFDLLDDWRHLPAYQLERRADIFFALYLDKIIKQKTGVDIDFIIPEFPVRVGEISEKNPHINQSFKIDYLAYSKESERVFLVELKTDQRSRRDKQDWYLQRTAQIQVKGILEGLKKIYKATHQKVKYNYLLDKLQQMGWLTRTEKSFDINNINISPEILYIQPKNTTNDDSVISFDDVITALSNTNDELAKRFVVSLEKWKGDVNKI